MTIIPTADLEFNSTNIQDDETAIWNPKTSYVAGTVRKYGNKLFEALGDDGVDPIVDYIYDETDPLNPNKTKAVTNINFVIGSNYNDNTYTTETINDALYDKHLRQEETKFGIGLNTLPIGTNVTIKDLVLYIPNRTTTLLSVSYLDFYNVSFNSINISSMFDGDYVTVSIGSNDISFYQGVIETESRVLKVMCDIKFTVTSNNPYFRIREAKSSTADLYYGFAIKRQDAFQADTFEFSEVSYDECLCKINDTVVQRIDDTASLRNYVFDDATGLESYYTYTNELAFYYMITDTFYVVDFSSEDKNNPQHFTEDLVNTYTTDALTPQDNPLYWLDLGYTNKYKMLDTSLNSETVYNGNMEMSFIVNKCDSIFLFGLYGTDVNVTITSIDGLTEYFNTDYDLENKNGGTFYNYFFNDFTYDDKFYETQLFTNIPLAYDVKVSITINALNGVSKCGLVCIGREYNIGGTTYGSSVSSRDFSTKAENSQGEIYLEKGNIKRTNSLMVEIPNNMIDKVVELLDKFRATPIVFKGVHDIRTTVVFGIYNKYDVIIQTPTISKLNIDYESLI